MKADIQSLIRKYERRIEDKKERIKKVPNDCLNGIILALEDVIEDLKQLTK
jgi:hypothetical protein